MILWVASLDYGVYSGWASAGFHTKEEAITALESAKRNMESAWQNIRNERIDTTCTTCGDSGSIMNCVCKCKRSRYSSHTQRCHAVPCPDCSTTNSGHVTLSR
jgi:hypothetical protein